ncbi:DUF3885 domain-containing protein [Pedobacter sp. L105]|uniref:DUF3885 domain-containing protein n=1 Tax=Pedobacter sp. L105 TaxID=1641871 RepID=UPI00131AA0FD|nr:DUF3885 domain-containing protein [Pedobacter sp. L105]
MIDSVINFEDLFIQKFGDIDRTSLSSLGINKLRFELGGEEEDLTRINQATERSNLILRYCFGDLPIWLRIILWQKDEESSSESIRLVLGKADLVLRDQKEEEVLYLHFKKYLQSQISPIATSIINYEMAEEPSSNITCYFVNFERSIVINIYDDRGMDVYAASRKFSEDLSSKFHDWLI